MIACYGATAASRLRPASAHALGERARAERARLAASTLASLRAALAKAPSEQALLRETVAALRRLWPNPIAAAAATLAQSSTVDASAVPSVLAMHGYATSSRHLAPLQSSLQAAPGDPASAVALACGFAPRDDGDHTSATRRVGAVSSDGDAGGDTGAHADWAAVGGAARVVTAPLTAGAAVVGWVQLHEARSSWAVRREFSLNIFSRHLLAMYRDDSSLYLFSYLSPHRRAAAG